MMKKHLSTCMILTCCLYAAESGATLLIFDVHVTNSNVSGFTPFSFTETADLNSFYTSPVNLNPSAGNLLKSTASATVDYTGSPLTAALLSNLGQIDLSGSLYAEMGFYQDYSSGTGAARLESQSVQLYQTPDNLWHYDTYYSILSVPDWNIVDADDVIPITLDVLENLFLSSPQIYWGESARVQISTDSTGFDVISNEYWLYSGTAQLQSPQTIPTPSSFILMLSGLICMLLLRRKVA